MIYRLNRWYDDLDEEHGAFRFLLFLFLAFWPYILVPFTERWYEVYAVNVSILALGRVYYMVRYARSRR